MQGCQNPRIAHAPKFAWSAGDDCVALVSSFDLTLDGWQSLVATAWLAEDKNGKLVAGKCGLAVARQNGKNGTVEGVQLYKMVVQGRRILHTAHEVKTARKHFLRMLGFFENERKYPELAGMVREIRRTNGQEAIVLSNGASLEFIARSKGSGRGYTVDDLYFDEAQELTDEQLEALLPTISAAPSGDPQQVYIGTPPGPNSDGLVFARVRAEGVSGKARRLSWHEWSIPDDIEPASAIRRWRELAYATNPALGIRLNIGTVEDELGAMSPEGFCRERLGQWGSGGSRARVFNASTWQKLQGPMPQNGTHKCFGVKFTPDGAFVGLAGAMRTPAGVHVEGLRQANAGEGMRWLVDFLVERKADFVEVLIDGKSGAGALVQALCDAGLRNPKQVRVLDFASHPSAHAGFLEAVSAEEITHGGGELAEQAKDATKRVTSKIAGTFGWESQDGTPTPLLDAATLAFWACKTTKRSKARTSVRGAVL